MQTTTTTIIVEPTALRTQSRVFTREQMEHTPDELIVREELLSIADKVAWERWPWARPVGAGYGIAGGDGSLVAAAPDRTLTPVVPAAGLSSLPRREQYVKPIRESTDLIASNMVRVTQALIDAAIGYKMTVRNKKTGDIEDVYDRPPDVRAGEILMNRLMGKPEDSKRDDNDGQTTNTIHIYIPTNGREASQEVPTQETIDIYPE